MEVDALIVVIEERKMMRTLKVFGLMALLLTSLAKAESIPTLPGSDVPPPPVKGHKGTATPTPAVDPMTGRPIQAQQSQSLADLFEALGTCLPAQGAPKGPYSR